MKKSIFFTLVSILIFSFAARAQDSERYSSSRLSNLASQLKRQSVDLADRASEDLRRSSNARSDIENAFLAHQLDASAGLFQQMVDDRSRASDLRDAAAILSDLARRAPTYGTNNNLWRDAQRTVGEIERELGGGGIGIGEGIGDGAGNSAGSVIWRGMVDDTVQIDILNRTLAVRTISGNSFGDGTFDFTSGLPRRNVFVTAIKKKGRGTVRVVQQPNRANGYKAIVEVVDRDNGAKEYELEINWK